MDIDLYSDLEAGLDVSGKLIERDDLFIRVGRHLLELYRKGVEDALALNLDGVIYVIHSELDPDVPALAFSDKRVVYKMTVDMVLRKTRQPDDDVTAACLDAFSGRFR